MRSSGLLCAGLGSQGAARRARPAALLANAAPRGSAVTGPFRVRGSASVHRRRWEGQPGRGGFRAGLNAVLRGRRSGCPRGRPRCLQPVRGRRGSFPLSRSLEFGPKPRGPRSCPDPSTVSPSALPQAAAEKRGPWAGRDARLPRLDCAQPVGKTFPEEPQDPVSFFPPAGLSLLPDVASASPAARPHFARPPLQPARCPGLHPARGPRR